MHCFIINALRKTSRKLPIETLVEEIKQVDKILLSLNAQINQYYRYFFENFACQDFEELNTL